ASSGNLAVQQPRNPLEGSGVDAAPPPLHWCLVGRAVFGGVIFEAARALRLSIAEVADLREPTPARLLGRGLLALTLFFAVDAQLCDRAREQPAERDGLAALLADVDLVVLQTDQLLRYLAEQEFLAIVQPHLGGEDLFLHRL